MVGKRAAFVTVLLLVCRAAAAGDPTIVINLRDYADLPAATLSHARNRVTEIYAAAGIRTVWTLGAEPNRPDVEGLHLAVILFSRSMGEEWIKKTGVEDGVLGQALIEAKRAYVFAFRIEKAAASPNAMDNLLANVIAHEVGHLALPTAGHSRRGLMRASFDPRSPLVERFTEDQRDALKRSLSH
jgi:hypothetical protein